VSEPDILAAVDDQLSELRKQLSVQLTRTGQVQAELDRQRSDLRDVHEQLRQLQVALKRFLLSTT
jgi:septal ring factor EnvC (AmiA/AmiB activator)